MIGGKQYTFVGGVETGQNSHKHIVHEITQGVVGGYLFKKGRGRYSSFVKPWSLRYMAVDTLVGLLQYYDEPRDIVRQRLPKGQLYISGSVFAEEQEREFCFSLTITKTTGETETLMLAALDASHLTTWLEVIRPAIETPESKQQQSLQDSSARPRMSRHMRIEVILICK
jgi:PH domain